jgi:hypothetical protein
MERKLRKIIRSKDIPAFERGYIVEASKMLGVVFTPKGTKCADCYRDQAIILLNKIMKEKIQSGKIKRAYVLRPETDIIWNGFRINAGTITDTLAETMCKAGLKKFFIKTPDTK